MTFFFLLFYPDLRTSREDRFMVSPCIKFSEQQAVGKSSDEHFGIAARVQWLLSRALAGRRINRGLGGSYETQVLYMVNLNRHGHSGREMALRQCNLGSSRSVTAPHSTGIRSGSCMAENACKVEAWASVKHCDRCAGPRLGRAPAAGAQV